MGLLTGTPSMAIPACIVGGIGGILYWQNQTGDWLSWTYAWALIPGFVGVGMILAAILGEGGWPQVWKGAESILVSLVLFVIFGSIFGGLMGLGPYWPVLLILIGIVQLIRRVLRPFPKPESAVTEAPTASAG
jgi:peptidoglycan/LPS O-acetylase OafA/YrhL